tara:strand:- start:1161 stop:1517 length:357 start_codon:yes stop_codon:yes gene_type:complete
MSEEPEIKGIKFDYVIFDDLEDIMVDWDFADVETIVLAKVTHHNPVHMTAEEKARYNQDLEDLFGPDVETLRKRKLQAHYEEIVRHFSTKEEPQPEAPRTFVQKQQAHPTSPKQRGGR